tara:strand:+ start:408 stop:845 length:438 start_codon:yes stop_codon:yes gene_type:complete
MKSDKEKTKLKTTLDSEENFNKKIKEVESQVRDIPDMEVPAGKIYLQPDELGNEEWKKENVKSFQVGGKGIDPDGKKFENNPFSELDKKIDKQMNDDYREHIQRELIEEIYNEAVNVRLDYEENPSEEPKSLIRIHQDSKFLKEK